MKKFANILLPFFFVLLLLGCFSSCNKEESSENGENPPSFENTKELAEENTNKEPLPSGNETEELPFPSRQESKKEAFPVFQHDDHAYIPYRDYFPDYPIFKNGFENDLLIKFKRSESAHYESTKEIVLFEKTYHPAFLAMKSDFKGIGIYDEQEIVRHQGEKFHIQREFLFRNKGKTMISYSLPLSETGTEYNLDPAYLKKEAVRLLSVLHPDFGKEAEKMNVDLYKTAFGSTMVEFGRPEYKRHEVENTNKIYVEYRLERWSKALPSVTVYYDVEQFENFPKITYEEAESLALRLISQDIEEDVWKQVEKDSRGKIKGIKDLTLDRFFYTYIGNRKALYLGIQSKFYSEACLKYYESGGTELFFDSGLLIVLEEEAS